MKTFRCVLHVVGATMLAFCLSLGADNLLGQTGAGSLHGQVLDPSGAAVPNASVQVTTPAGQVLKANTNSAGSYEFTNLAPGSYTVEATVKGFTPYRRGAVAVISGQATQVTATLEIAAQKDELTVSDEALSVDTTPSTNASAVVLTEKELEALPDDPDELQQDLEALAGPSAGPNGGQMYIDGFTAGQLPPKSSIREIRINQSPFAPEFDKVGYGRIEIFTKPGTNQWHGQISVNKNDAALNSRDPFATTNAGFASTQIEGNIGGPLRKNASLFFNVDERNIHDQALIDAVTLAFNCNQGSITQQITCSESVANPRTRVNGGPRIDYQLTKNNTLSGRYQFFRNDSTDAGVGGLTLPSAAYNVRTTEQTLQLTDTQVIGSKIINETHFQYRREDGTENPYSPAPEIDVLGAFNAGGNSRGSDVDRENLYELQNYTSVAYARHFVKFGVRLRAMSDSNTSTGNQATGFNGAFTFSSLNAYAATEQYLAANPLATTLPSGLGPTQFSLVTGTPRATVSMYDLGPYIQDDWRLRPNLTLSYGLRFETQNRISDHADFAPRLGVAWGIGGAKPKTVVRAGWGLFYDRFAPNFVLQAERLNGFTEQEYVISQPGFFCANSIAVAACPSIANLQNTSIPTIYQIAANLRSPMLMQTAVSIERQLTKIANVSISYLNSRGWRQLLTANINAPEINGIPTSPASGGVYPNGVVENLYQYESAGIFRQNQLVLNTTIRAGAKLSLNAYYSLNYANSDTAGANSFASDPYNLMADYGRAAFDIRNRFFLGGTVGLRYGLRLSPFLVASSGVPYNITLGKDLTGTSIFNQRPGLVSSAACRFTEVTGIIYCTPFGTFDSQPTASESVVPINYLTGPSQFSLNVRLTKTFTFGRLPEGTAGQVGARQNGGGGQRGAGEPGGGRPPVGGGFGFGGAPTAGRYSVVLSLNVRNIFNNVNLATPIGTLTSPLFGESNSLSAGGLGFGGGAQTAGAGAAAGLPTAGAGAPAANRQIFLQATFGF